MGGIMAILFTLFMIMLIPLLLILISNWIIFTKAGKPGWASIIPIYNNIVQLEIVGKPWWWLFLLCIPFVNLVLAIMLLNLLSKSFGQGVGFTLGLIFLGFIFFPIMAFSSSIKYVGPAGIPANNTAAPL